MLALNKISSSRRVRVATLLAVGAFAPASVNAGLYADFLRAADSGECIEHVTYRMIREHGVGQAATVVAAALRALSEREAEQRALGCDGDIATQAIAAGADPDDVLEATAAGL